MILMALDHTRDFLGVGANPVDLATTTTPLFFTRWITHFCAPTFFLLTGTSAYLSRRGRSDRQLSWHLLTRGAWLILFELTVFRGLALQFNFDYRTTPLLVLWALGWAMMLLSVLIYLPRPAIAAVGALMWCAMRAMGKCTGCLNRPRSPRHPSRLRPAGGSRCPGCIYSGPSSCAPCIRFVPGTRGSNRSGAILC
jgi:uncharacterized membrane protein